MRESVPLVAVRRLDVNGREYIDDACREWGMFRVVAHGIETHLMQRMLREAELLFALPKERKYYIRRTADNVWGYHDRECTGTARDWKEVYDVGPAAKKGPRPLAGSTPRWPPSKYAFRKTVEEFMHAGEELSQRLIKAISLSLGHPAHALGRYFRGKHTSHLRLNYHPHCGRPAPASTAADVPADAPAPAPVLASVFTPTLTSTPNLAPGSASGHFGIGAHTDAGALTVLLQDESACLQVLKDGRWVSVDPIPGSLVVILGDLVRVWSNDVYVAPVHRVLASKLRDQHSVAYHFNPPYKTDVAPFSDEPLYEPVNWGEYRARRSAHDYNGAGEDARLAHYRRGGPDTGSSSDGEADALAVGL